MAAAVGDELRVLGTWSSPWVIRVRVALGLKGLSYNYAEEDLTNKSDLLLKSNPVHGKVPVLIHAGRPVCESLVILEYIDEAWPGTAPPLLPSDPYDRATARFWAAYVNDTGAIQVADGGAEGGGVRERRPEGGDAGPGVQGKAFFGGDDVGIVDIALGSHLVWIRVVDEVGGTNLVDGAKFPALAAWAERFMAVDAVRKVMPDAGKVLEQYKGFRAKWIAAAGST
ncbi:unnamed protein product [Urochloa humidicola]